MIKKLSASEMNLNLTNNGIQINLVKAGLRLARKWKLISMAIKACEH